MGHTWWRSCVWVWVPGTDNVKIRDVAHKFIVDVLSEMA
jgi:hypothetical protein